MSRAVFAALTGAICTLLGALVLSPACFALLPPVQPYAVPWAQRYLGAPYLAGGATPEGFDDGGLVVFVYTQLGIAVPQDLAAMQGAGRPVEAAERGPGDVVFWDEGDGLRAGIYAGGGTVICASAEGGIVRYELVTADTITGMRRLGSFTGGQAAELALAQVGARFLAGGETPDGFGKAGLTRFVYAQLELWLPPRLRGQVSLGRRASLERLRRGDLVFWAWGSALEGHWRRVGIYVGGGQVVCASPTAGKVVVRSTRGADAARRLLPVL